MNKLKQILSTLEDNNFWYNLGFAIPTLLWLAVLTWICFGK